MVKQNKKSGKKSKKNSKKNSGKKSGLTKKKIKNSLKKVYKLDPNELENVKSWILYSLRFALLNKNVRNKILQSSQWFGKFKKKGYQIILGDIYGEGISDNELEKLMNHYISLGDNKIILFTLSNNPRNTMDPDKRETHFQSFILVNRIKTVFAFDPAMSTGTNIGVYYPGAIIQIEKLFNNLNYRGYNIVRPDIQYACQVDKSDVFCQTWSLYLQYEYMRQLCELNLDFTKIHIVIPYDIIDKYQLLNSFIQDIIKIKIVRDTLESQFVEDVNIHNLPSSYLNVNSYNYLSNFSENDYIHGDEIKKQQKRDKRLSNILNSLDLSNITLTNVRSSRSRN
tara:strand:- start:2025 stop:3041 length:1017 start_codon:yes stop_codon:yes gene_type:complete